MVTDLEGYLIKKEMYIDASGKACESIKDAELFKFKSDAENASKESGGRVIKIKKDISVFKKNQGWMRK